MAITTAAGITSTTVTTTQQAPLGFQLVVPNGDFGLQTWVYVFNDDAAGQWDVGDLIQLDTDFALYHGIQSAVGALAKLRVLGAAQHIIPAGSYGFILQKGRGTVNGDGTLNNAGELMVSRASARAGEMAAAEEAGIFGINLTASAVAGAALTCLIDCGP
tara:strand:+ start:240 stop:719 length:480 start_codon:yes stop_codon:yes gene_type:complete